MPLPPQPIVPATPLSPRRVLLESPLAAASLMRARRRWREPPRTRARHWAALIGTLLVHLLFLAIFVLGPPYDWQPPRAPPEAFLQVRLIDADELPPPPPASATPPRQVGPRHQGSASAAAMRGVPVEALGWYDRALAVMPQGTPAELRADLEAVLRSEAPA